MSGGGGLSSVRWLFSRRLTFEVLPKKFYETFAPSPALLAAPVSSSLVHYCEATRKNTDITRLLYFFIFCKWTLDVYRWFTVDYLFLLFVSLSFRSDCPVGSKNRGRFFIGFEKFVRAETRSSCVCQNDVYGISSSLMRLRDTQVCITTDHYRLPWP